MQVFLDSLREKTSSYRSESIKKVTKWQETEQEYKDIKGSVVDPALKSFRKPERVRVNRVERPEIPIARHSHLARSPKMEMEIRTPRRKAQEAPFSVMNFQTEKWTAFTARSGHIFMGRSYPSAFTRKKMRREKETRNEDMASTLPK